MKPKKYLSEIITLIAPIGSIESLTVRPLTLIQDIELGDNPDECEKIALMTGVDIDVIERLSTPDWNDVATAANKFSKLTSYDLAGRKYDPSEKKVTILFADKPYTVNFTLPTVGMTRKAKKMDNPQQILRFYLLQLTELSKQQLEDMYIPDYRMIDDVVADFLSQSGDYFQ